MVSPGGCGIRHVGYLQRPLPSCAQMRRLPSQPRPFPNLRNSNTLMTTKAVDVDGRSGNPDTAATALKVIYKLPSMRHWRFVSRLKLVHVGAMTAMAIGLLPAIADGSAAPEVGALAAAAAIGSAGVLAALSVFSQQVCLLCTLWGRRRLNLHHRGDCSWRLPRPEAMCDAPIALLNNPDPISKTQTKTSSLPYSGEFVLFFFTEPTYSCLTQTCIPQ